MKSLKKLLAAVLTIGMLAGCSSSTPASSGGEAGGDVKTYKVGVAIYQFNDNFMTLYRNEIENYFKTKETDTVKYEVKIVDSANDMAKQSEQIDGFLTEGMDVIILNLVQTSSAESMIQKIMDKNIPLVLINREPKEGDVDESYPGIVDNATVCYVGADARDSGTFQGKIIADLENHGDINGDGKVTYLMIKGDPENSDAQYRTEYSIKALEDAGITAERVCEDQVGNWDLAQGQTIAANALAQYGDAIEVIFCNNDAMAVGAAKSIDSAGRKCGEDIYLVGVDAIDDALDLIKQGKMTGTVLNDANGQAHKAVDVAIQLLNGEKIENYYWVPYVPVTE